MIDMTRKKKSNIQNIMNEINKQMKDKFNYNDSKMNN